LPHLYRSASGGEIEWEERRGAARLIEVERGERREE